MSRPFRIVRLDPKTGRVLSKSPFSRPNMTPHELTGNAATTAPRESLDRKIHATLNIKKSPMPSSLAKRMDEACATDLRQLKRATFPEEPTLALSALSRNTRFQPAFVKPADNTTISAEPTATVTSSTIPSYYTRFQPATARSADNTTTTTSITARSSTVHSLFNAPYKPATLIKSADNTTSTVGSSTIPSYYTRSQPALAMSADNTTTTTSSTVSSSTAHSRNTRFRPAYTPAESTTSSVGTSTTHSRNIPFQPATRPAEIGVFTRNTSGVRVWHPAPTFTLPKSLESRSSSSVRTLNILHAVRSTPPFPIPRRSPVKEII
jgi:hypothetical protein